MGLGSPRGHLSERKSRALCQRFPFLHSASSAARRASHAVCVFISPSPAQAASAPVTWCLLRDSQAIEGPLCAASSVPISYEKQPRAVTCTGTAPSPSPRAPFRPAALRCRPHPTSRAGGQEPLTRWLQSQVRTVPRPVPPVLQVSGVHKTPSCLLPRPHHTGDPLSLPTSQPDSKAHPSPSSWRVLDVCRA